jgi:hypothetical protein
MEWLEARHGRVARRVGLLLGELHAREKKQLRRETSVGGAVQLHGRERQGSLRAAAPLRPFDPRV